MTRILYSTVVYFVAFNKNCTCIVASYSTNEDLLMDETITLAELDHLSTLLIYLAKTQTTDTMRTLRDPNAKHDDLSQDSYKELFLKNLKATFDLLDAIDETLHQLENEDVEPHEHELRNQIHRAQHRLDQSREKASTLWDNVSRSRELSRPNRRLPMPSGSLFDPSHEMSIDEPDYSSSQLDDSTTIVDHGEDRAADIRNLTGELITVEESLLEWQEKYEMW